MNAKDFRTAYLKTIYTADDIQFTLSSEATTDVLFAGRKFIIITAYNPRSQQLPELVNNVRHEVLEADVAKNDWQFAPSLGVSPDGEWQEVGFVIFDQPLEEMIALAKTYGQHAILYGEAGKVALAWSETAELEWCWAKLV